MDSRQKYTAVQTDISDSRKGSSQYSTKQIAMASSVKKKTKCSNSLKMFMVALTFSFICKALSGVIMKSSITQIERRFGITTSKAGLIDGSFEIGNLLVITLVSHFGAKSHIPRIIGIGCLLMGTGSMLTALPHFLMGNYRYNSVLNINPLDNSTVPYTHCSNDFNSPGNNRSSILLESGCKRESGSLMWIYIMIGNILRGVGESPIGPLGITYIDNFAKEGHSTFYLGILHSFAMIGPMIGYLLGSLCAKLYVDFASVDLSFFYSLKCILSNQMYLMFLISTLMTASSFIGSITYLPKYLELEYGVSISNSNFLLGTATMPVVAISVFLGGYISKKFKLSVIGIAILFFISRISSLIFQVSFWFLTCENQPVAGLTVAYNGNDPWTQQNVSFSFCNSDCNCDTNTWDPVCGDDGLTYMSPCLAGCKSSVGHGKDLVFHNCSCVEANNFQSGKASAYLGTCSKTDNCSRNFIYYIILCVLASFAIGLGGASSIILIFKFVEPELKSLALGCHSVVVRTLGGILAPIYYGAAMDVTCLKWGTNNCGDRGACRMYDPASFRNTFFGLNGGLRAPELILYIFLYIALKKKYQENNTGPSNNEGIDVDQSNFKESLKNNEQLVSSAYVDNESHI
ncbi:solute carrier organic anion transporter family member 1B3-like isoform X2 [Notamacropus eugenii]|uniref:solute carrier organic anion transporter family member 1B3-like isoform X2 n=1 Tax=Notamacropus eugenii TaxID=9315 RepID=UPI003B679E24